ncbi:heparan-alpha-glucosaminide N-acetyltransferase domain-containing protein [Brevibacterium casei]|uniref:heparan-alpha-glucosaminide N-acetyltransferase domain-containing protein n=1 Tax=Brevibacterium casei TaxID=33889 RepID=UPI0036FEE0A6
MSTQPATPSVGIVSRLSPQGRLVGLDAARGLALLTMMITHIYPLTDEALPTWATVFSGRASALFAVLAGCSLVLSTRSTLAATGRLRDVAPGVLVRAASIIVIGLFLGAITTNLAVILVNYGVMFGIALLFLRLRAWALFTLAGVWMVLSPILSMWLRSTFGLDTSYLPMSWFDLGTLWQLGIELTLTGYYPILQWMAYILLGMAVAKIDIGKHLTALFLAGVALFLIGRGSSWLLLNVFGGLQELEAVATASGADLTAALYVNSYGVTPTDSWWWLAIAGPHSATPFDLISTAGTSLAAIAVCQAAAILLGRRSWLLAPLSAPGSMPLTVYAAHVVLVEITHPFFQPAPMIESGDPAKLTTEYLIHAMSFVVFAIVWKLFVSPRGPLEGVIASLVRAVSPKRPERPERSETSGSRES